jgi:hypothetical protein
MKTTPASMAVRSLIKHVNAPPVAHVLQHCQLSIVERDGHELCASRLRREPANAPLAHDLLIARLGSFGVSAQWRNQPPTFLAQRIQPVIDECRLWRGAFACGLGIH